MPLLTESKCTCCGAPVNPNSGENGVLRCEYCGSMFTLTKPQTDPAACDSIRIGNHELDIGKFDDAYESFKKAAQIDSSEPEAYMGMAYAAHKVRYIRDEVNNCLQPICYEYENKQFIQDNNYIKATQLATPEQLAQYERNAADIDYIRKEFNKLRNSNLDYDCFICVKVTDDNTKLYTEDCQTADKIYTHLSRKGYKPFFSEREIGNRTGADYEALILYALYASECMIVVCSNESYLQTPWVKNEYTRFLKLINDEDKESSAITVVFGGTPIERLPNRKGKLQGIDMRGIDPYGKITAFVEEHTPEAKARREQCATKICVNCGSENKQSAKFCSECGGNEFVNSTKEYNEYIRKKIEAEYAEKLKAMQAQQQERPNPVNNTPPAVTTKPQPKINLNDFEIENGVLKKYKGKGGNVTIPDSVKSIGDWAFKNYISGFASLTIPNSVTSIGVYAFTECNYFKSVTVDENNMFYSSQDGILYDKKKTKFIHIPRYISGAITIPDSITRIWDWTFKYCDNLASIKVCKNNAYYSSQDGILYNKKKTEFIHIPRCISGAVTIPDGITGIGNNGFEGCSSLTSITIPDSVMFINWFAFSSCSSLTSIIYKGTKTQWSNVEKEFGWDSNTGDYVIHCTDGDISKK